MNVLTLRALGIGDLLTAVPALRALQRAFPEHRQTLAAPAFLTPLVEMVRGIDEVIDTAPLAPIDARAARATIAVNLHGCGPQSHRVLLQTEPQRLIAFRNDEVPETQGFPAWRAGEHEIDRWCRLLEENGIPTDRGDFALTVVRRDPRSCDAIVIHPGAASESRRWPVERWTSLCRRVEALGLRVLITGSAAEVELCRTIATSAGLPQTAMLAGTTVLNDLASIVAGARAIVCGDTGIAHLATAVRTPSVVLFGPTSPREWGPPPSDLHRILWRGTYGDPHGDEVDPGLAQIETGEVFVALCNVLASGAAKAATA